MKRMSRDENGYVGALLANPIALLVVLIALVIGAIFVSLFVIYAKDIAAAVGLMIIGVLIFWKVPMPDPRMRFGILMVFIVLAVIIYFYGAEILAVVA